MADLEDCNYGSLSCVPEIVIPHPPSPNISDDVIVMDTPERVNVVEDPLISDNLVVLDTPDRMGYVDINPRSVKRSRRLYFYSDTIVEEMLRIILPPRYFEILKEDVDKDDSLGDEAAQGVVGEDVRATDAQGVGEGDATDMRIDVEAAGIVDDVATDGSVVETDSIVRRTTDVSGPYDNEGPPTIIP